MRREDELNDTIQSRCQLTQKDADRLMRVHQAEMEEYERMRKAEKKRMNAALEEKLEQRRLVKITQKSLQIYINFCATCTCIL